MIACPNNRNSMAVRSVSPMDSIRWRQHGPSNRHFASIESYTKASEDYKPLHMLIDGVFVADTGERGLPVTPTSLVGRRNSEMPTVFNPTVFFVGRNDEY